MNGSDSYGDVTGYVAREPVGPATGGGLWW